MNSRLLICFIFLICLTLVAGCEDDDNSSSDDTANDDDDDFINPDDDDDDDDVTDDDDNDDDTGPGPYFDDFSYYWNTLDQGYAYFIEKGIDWDGIYEQYEQAAYSASDLSEFTLLISEMTASLGDSHTWSSTTMVLEEYLPYRPATGVCLERIGEKIYVTKTTVGAKASGVELGDEVLLLDGEPVDDVLAEAMSWEGCSSHHCCDYYRLSYVDRYSEGQDSVVYTIKRGGQNHEVTLERQSHVSGSCKGQALEDYLADAQGTRLKYKFIDSDLGYIHLSTLSDSYKDVILDELDDALAAFAGRSGIIFDARYNTGGSDLVAMAVLSRFLGEVIFPVTFRYVNGPAHDDFTIWIPEPVLPGVNPVTTPVVFLINGGCISAADFFVAAASYVQTFTLMGTPSCGATGAPIRDTLPASGIAFAYSQMQRKYLLTGEQVEGIGIAPEIFVEQDPDDVSAGIDTQIEQAVGFLRGLK